MCASQSEEEAARAFQQERACTAEIGMLRGRYFVKLLSLTARPLCFFFTVHAQRQVEVAQRQAEVARRAEQQAVRLVRLRLQKSLAAHANGPCGFVHLCINSSRCLQSLYPCVHLIELSGLPIAPCQAEAEAKARVDAEATAAEAIQLVQVAQADERKAVERMEAALRRVVEAEVCLSSAREHVREPERGKGNANVSSRREDCVHGHGVWPVGSVVTGYRVAWDLAE